MKKARIPKRPSKRKLRRRKTGVIIGLILSVGLAGMIAGGWRGIRSLTGSSISVPQPTATPQLSKEYIYAGGKLIAIEEPGSGGGTSPLSPPANLVATGDSLPSAQVNLHWSAATGGTVHHYQVERCQAFGPNCYTVVAASVSPASPTTNYSDTTVTSGTAYLYRVRAIDTNGLSTNASGVDLATAVTFANDPLVGSDVNPGNATTISAVHFTQLQAAVNAVRRLVDPQAPEFNWTEQDHVPVPGGGIYKSHLNNLRDNLSDALFALGFTRPTYEAPDPMTSGQPIRAIHVQQVRDLVK